MKVADTFKQMRCLLQAIGVIYLVCYVGQPHFQHHLLSEALGHFLLLILYGL